MPIKSMAQLKAMLAAAEGDSTLDIPKKVAKEYLRATPRKRWADLPEKAKPKK